MKNVVYVLGAGFSAYAGLPIMSNFIEKSRDIYFSDSTYENNEEIKEALNLIKKYSVIKNIMNCNLLNIEELLSIYDMKLFTANSKKKTIIQTFIKSVISYYQDKFLSTFKITNRAQNIVATSNSQDYYAVFLLNMFGIETTGHEVYVVGDHNRYEAKVTGFNKSCNYGIITFNYDTILEKISHGIATRLDYHDNNFLNTLVIDDDTIRYCKLHGSIDKGTIIPPTWAKSSFPQVKKDWEDAFTLLKLANDIRIIGFSFPDTDSHVSYLFKSALSENENLKKIDVICLDNNDYIKNKYTSKFCFENFRFKNAGVEDYFGLISKAVSNNRINYAHDTLEYIHEHFMAQNL
jgi:hypothetical protein